MAERPRLILASGSAARASMLRAAGVDFEVLPSSVDEDAVRAELARSSYKVMPENVAFALAEAKAVEVSKRHPDALVIGGDQVLALDDEIFSKPSGVDEARAQLLALRGRRHILFSAVVLVRGGQPIWADLVGCYQIEGLGITLFERVDGDHFTILGMPLLPLLRELRALEAIAS
jgi:septum formation protein